MKRILTIVVGLFAFAGSLLAEHPNEARGFAADRVYSVQDVDAVNAFNGNLIVRIPIGPEYRVNGQLSYRLMLTYNSHLWHFISDDFVFGPEHDESHFVSAFPSRTDNAGLGWRLSLGNLYSIGDPDITPISTPWVYQGADGSSHNFYNSPHLNDTTTSSALYTRDNSYIRLTSVDTLTTKVEFPDGTIQTFRQMRRDTWHDDDSSHKWYLTSIADLLGNSVTISYSATADYPEIWTIGDGARTIRVYFRTGATTDFLSTLDHVDMQSAGGAALSYLFAIPTALVPMPAGDTSNRGLLHYPLLTAITPSTGKGYSMMIGTAPAYDTTTHISAGALTRLTLPTLGSVGWAHNLVRYTQTTTHRSPGVERPSGVIQRTTYDPAGNPLATWNYDRKISSPEFCTSFVCNIPPGPCSSGRPRQMTVFITDPVTTDGVQKTTINYFSNYEVLSDPDGESCPTAGWVSSDHGLPFTRYAPKNGRFLSGEVRTGSVFASLGDWNGRGQVPTTIGTRLRETYVTYDADPNPHPEDDEFITDKNARLSSTAAYFVDDLTGVEAEPYRYTAANYLGFDGFGHYRQVSTDGNFPGTGNYRTTFTNYNAAPALLSPWLLTPFTEQCTVDETALRSAAITPGNGACSTLPSAFISRMQFNANGLLTARRTLLQSSNQPHDLLAIFAYDSHGNVTGENYYGGDMQTLNGATEFAPPTPLPPPEPPPPPQPPPIPPPDIAYSVSHALTYASGALTGDKATYSNGVNRSDETYDQTTGVVTDVHDVSGLNTHYIYDALNRVTHVQPPGVAETTYTYSDASFSSSVFTPAKVLAESSGAGVGSIRKEYQYDPFGRLWRQKSLLADGVSWNIVQNEFDFLGRKSAVSMPEKLVGLEGNFAPARKTTFGGYDAFGRATSVVAPDGFTTDFAFTGIRSVQRTVNVATTSTGCTPSNSIGCLPATTEEIHDAVGRLVQVTEPSGDTSLSKPNGDPVTTTYKYDSGDHLTEVRTLSQTRTFTYDHRGFLTLEQHPEVGVNGGQPITYVYTSPQGMVGYDARGHVRGKLTGTLNGLLDLRYDYDPSERLLKVFDFGDTKRPLKEYTYWADDTVTTGNHGSGKLNEAIRHNHPGGFPGEVTVKETYTYATPSGRVSQRDTLIESVNGASRTTLQSFTQNSTYDQFGSIAQIDYPACGVACIAPSPVGPTYTRANGFLTAVAGYASAITYNADGSINEVTHDATHGVKDTYAPDNSGMGRPGVISFAGASSCTASAAVTGSITIVSGQSAQLTATLSGGSHAPSAGAPWTIVWFDGVNSVSQSVTQSPWTRTVTPAATTQYTITSVTDGSCFGSGNGMATVTVQACNAQAAVTGNASITQGQTTTITATLSGSNPPSGAAPWSITWSDGVTENGVNHSPWTRSVRPLSSTNYSITSFTAGAGCSGAGTGTAAVTVANLPAPTAMTADAITDPVTNTTLTVSLHWNVVQFADWYQVERATRLLPAPGDWQPVGGHLTSISTTDPFSASANPVTYLYRVRAGVTSGNATASSVPSAIDYATVATTLFTDERLVAGVTPVKGIHMGELRHAIDAVRLATGALGPAWSFYGAASGSVTASDNITARQRLDEATVILIGHGVAYTGEVPASNGRIWAIQLQQIRDGVR